MSAKTKKNIRKIILLNTNQNNNISRQLKINNKFPKIAFSNDIISYANKDNKGIKYRSQTDPDIAINKSKLNLKNNISNIIKVDSITNTTININNISPKKKQDETSNSIKKDKNKSEQKITLKPLKTENNSILELFLNGIKEQKLQIENPEVTLYMIIELVSSTCFNSILYKEPLPIDEFKPYLYKEIKKLIND